MVMYNNYWPIVLQFYSLDSMISSFNVFSLSLSLDFFFSREFKGWILVPRG